MARHTMTPARRAALRKAQLASARKRRKNSTYKSAKRDIAQRREYNQASRQLQPKKKRRIGRNIAIAATIAAGAAAGGYSANVYGKRTRSISVPKFSAPSQLGPGKIRGNPNPIHRPRTIYKTNSKGITLRTTHARQAYNASRRKK